MKRTKVLLEAAEIRNVEPRPGQQLIEDSYTLEFTPEDLTEAAGDGKRAKLKGRFGKVDVPTANKRVYPRKVMVKAFESLSSPVKNRQVFGELDHPGDGKTKLARVSHLVTGLQILETGEMVGELEFIPGTINGDQALAIAKAGGRLGVSSRGYGSTTPDSSGNQVVAEDYQLVTFDLVADPANANAHPEFVMEHKERTMDIQTLKAQHPELAEAIRKELESEARDHAREALREEFEARLSSEADKIRVEAVERAKAELLADPEVAGSAIAMERVKQAVAPYILGEDEEGEITKLRERIRDVERKLADADTEKKALVAEADELANISRELGFHLHLERELNGNNRREQVMEMIGNVLDYPTIDDLKERVTQVMEALAEEDERAQKYESELTKLRKENMKLAEERDKALEVGRRFGLRAYIERKISNHPHAPALRSYMSEQTVESAEDIDRLVEAYTAAHPVSDEFRRVHEGVRKNITKPREMTEDRQRERRDGSMLYGVSMDELVQRARRLS